MLHLGSVESDMRPLHFLVQTSHYIQSIEPCNSLKLPVYMIVGGLIDHRASAWKKRLSRLMINIVFTDQSNHVVKAGTNRPLATKKEAINRISAALASSPIEV